VPNLARNKARVARTEPLTRAFVQWSARRDIDKPLKTYGEKWREAGRMSGFSLRIKASRRRCDIRAPARLSVTQYVA